MRLPGFKTSHRTPSVPHLPVSYSEDGQFFTWASRRQALRVTAGGRRGARLARHLCGGLAVLAVALSVLRLWPASPQATAVPATGAISPSAAAFAPPPPASRTSDASYPPSTVPMPPPLPTQTLIIHALAYPLHPVITGGDPATGALPVPPVRAVVQVDSPAVRTFSHPPSVPITDPLRIPGR